MVNVRWVIDFTLQWNYLLCLNFIYEHILKLYIDIIFVFKSTKLFFFNYALFPSFFSLNFCYKCVWFILNLITPLHRYHWCFQILFLSSLHNLACKFLFFFFFFSFIFLPWTYKMISVFHISAFSPPAFPRVRWQLCGLSSSALLLWLQVQIWDMWSLALCFIFIQVDPSGYPITEIYPLLYMFLDLYLFLWILHFLQ